MFEQAEEFGRKSEWRFERTWVGKVPAISLSGRLGRRVLPAESVIWTSVFLDEECRDALFHWLCLRVERWNSWGKETSTLGAAWLTDHLLTLISCGMADATAASLSTASS